MQDGSEEDDGSGMDDDSLSDWNLSKSVHCLCHVHKYCTSVLQKR